jgi:retron-type reverse transcriptase
MCEAFYKAARGRQTRPEIIEFRKNFHANIHRLQQSLINQQVNLGNYTYFIINDPKKRMICAAAFEERVLHHAMMNICEPVLESCAIYDSYACRKNKGSHAAIKRAQKYANTYEWFLKLDIRKYFDSIDHEILLKLLSRKFKDDKLMALYHAIINSYHVQPGKGLPIGNLTSQHFANYYLCHFDHWIKEQRKVNAYVRYMDDFLLFNASPLALKQNLSCIKKYLADELTLEIKPAIQLNRSRKGIPFLGYRIFPQKILLQPQAKKRFIKKWKNYETKYLLGTLSENELAIRVTALIEYLKHADSKNYRKHVIKRFGVSF